MIVMTTIISLFWWWYALRFFSAMWIHTGEKPAQLWMLSGFISPTNTIFCNLSPLDLWWHVLSFITAMRTHTSVKPAWLQVLSKYIPILQIEFFLLKFLYMLFWWWYSLPWEPTLVKSLQNYRCSQDSSKQTKIADNDKHISTGIMVASSQFLQCHENTCLWEACTNAGAVRMYLSYKHHCL